MGNKRHIHFIKAIYLLIGLLVGCLLFATLVWMKTTKEKKGEPILDQQPTEFVAKTPTSKQQA